MRRQQQGVSLMALIFGFAILVIVAIFGMKLVPSYLEFRSAKTAIDALARAGGATPNDIRRQFESRSAVDDINSVKAQDLEITKQGNQVVISFSYRKEVPLFRNVGLYIDYQATSGGD
jgi:protein involved in polysaccharide export with SLBB domain